jgi:hypothetical protein
VINEIKSRLSNQPFLFAILLLSGGLNVTSLRFAPASPPGNTSPAHASVFIIVYIFTHYEDQSILYLLFNFNCQ